MAFRLSGTKLLPEPITHYQWDAKEQDEMKEIWKKNPKIA